MNILILNWKDIKNPDVGGAEIILYELAKRMIRDGHTVTWFCRTFPDATSQDEYDGIRVIRRGSILSVYWHAFLYYRALPKKPDRVIDCVNTICWQTPLYVPKSNRVMLVNQLAKEVFFYELPFPLSYIAYALERLEYLTYKNTKVLCYAPSTKKDLSTFGIPEKNISIFSLGVDHHRYKPGAKSKDPLFIFVARLARMKRPDLCVRAMRLVVDKHPKATLAIIGYGPMENTLIDLIHALDLANNVSLVNKNALYFSKNSKDQKVWYMQRAWALLLPSVKEGWGMVVTEAAACKTLSIVTDVTGLRDSVVAGNTGLVISSNPTVEELSTQIMRVIGGKSLRVTMSTRAQRRAMKHDWNASYHQFSTYLLA